MLLVEAGSHPTRWCELNPRRLAFKGTLLIGFAVLRAVYNKLNDPSPDDPFEPEIAQVNIP